MIEDVKINCPECNALLNMKNFDKHMGKVHGMYYNLSAKRKEEIYREREDIKVLSDNCSDQEGLKELQKKFKDLNLMLKPVSPYNINKILKSKIAAYNNYNKSLKSKIAAYNNKSLLLHQ